MVKPIFINKKKEKSKDSSNEKDNKIDFLSKKRIEPDTPNQEIDMVKLKKKVNEIMYSICNGEDNTEKDFEYETMSKNYLLNEFTNNCLVYINKIIINVDKNHLKKIQGTFELNKIFIQIIKELLMNEFELILLSLYLENFDLSYNNNIESFKQSLIFLCFFIKKLTLSKDKLSPINSFLIRKYQGFEDNYAKWFESNSSILNKKLYFSYVEINQRFKEFNKPYSIFCKSNYLDYNLIIDRILTMSIPYNETKGGNKSSNNKKSLNEIYNINNSLNNIYNEQSNSNMNLNQKYLYCNNQNNSKNYYPNYIPSYPGSIFFGQNNFGCLYNNNNANILYQLNQINNGQINSNTNFINRESIESNSQKEEKQNKKNIIFISKKDEDNNINNNNLSLKNELNGNNANPKLFLMNPSQNSTESKNDSKENNDNNDINITNNENDANKKIENKKDEKLFTPYILLQSMEQEKPKEKNILPENNNINKQNNIFNQPIPNNNTIKTNNNAMNLFQSNSILGLNMSQQMNDLNQLKYNSNIGINDINSASQLSLLSIRNPCFIDLNNLYNNYFQGIEGDDNYKQLYNNQSRENFFKSCLSINGINSSKNFYPTINNYNYANNYTVENDNNNNNSNIKHILIENPNLQNLNNLNNVTLKNNENKNNTNSNIEEDNAVKKNKNEN